MSVKSDFQKFHGLSVVFAGDMSGKSDYKLIAVKSVNKGCFIETYASAGLFFYREWKSSKVKRPYVTFSDSYDSVKAMAGRFIASNKMDLEDKLKASNHGVKAGDIFKCSWGYEQTNVDYYQVIKAVGKTTLELRPIAQHRITHKGQLAGSCAPDVGNFTGDSFRKRVSVYRGEVQVKIESYALAHLLTPETINGVKIYDKSEWTAYA